MIWKFNALSFFSSPAVDTSPCLPAIPKPETTEDFGSAFTTVAIDSVIAKSPAHDEDSKDAKVPKSLKQIQPRSPLLNFSPCWIIITCLKTRAIHLELASPGDNQSLLDAFNRFIKMWSPPEEVFFLNTQQSKSFQYPSAVHEDEAEIEIPDDHSRERLEAVLPMLQAVNKFKLVKNPQQPVWLHFYSTFIRYLRLSLREIFSAHLSTETAETVNPAHIKQIEDLVNSRPLLKHGNSWGNVLTPEHLVTGNPNAVYKPVSVKQPHSTGPSLAKSTLVTTFWQCWSRKYICSLMKFHQVQGYVPTLGEVVLLLRPTQTNNNNKDISERDDDANQANNTPFIKAAVKQIFSVPYEGSFSKKQANRSSAQVELEDGTTVIAELQHLTPFECTLQSVQLVNGLCMKHF